MPSSALRRWQPPTIISIAAIVPGAGSARSAAVLSIPASSSIWSITSTCVFSPPSSSMKFSMTIGMRS